MGSNYGVAYLRDGLEVSGIRKADDSRVRARVKQKIEQTNPSDGKFLAYIIIVEFSKPLSFIVEK
jgi:hypothetical protein